MALTDMKIKNAKPQDKPYKIADGDGMFSHRPEQHQGR